MPQNNFSTELVNPLIDWYTITNPASSTKRFHKIPLHVKSLNELKFHSPSLFFPVLPPPILPWIDSYFSGTLVNFHKCHETANTSFKWLLRQQQFQPDQSYVEKLMEWFAIIGYV